MKLQGNTILITGASSGIGLGLALALAERGNTVIICARRQKLLDKIQQQHPGIITRACDITDQAQRTELAEWATTTYPELNMLINNAGIQRSLDLTQPVDLTTVQSELAVNLVAPLALSALLVPHLRKQNSAAILNITSGLAYAPLATVPLYCATKAALHSLTLSLRYQLRSSTVAVYEIAPPAVATELGKEERQDPNSLHGGMPVDEFVTDALLALEKGELESHIGLAELMHNESETMFSRMNPL